jgi:hypothetical protein
MGEKKLEKTTPDENLAAKRKRLRSEEREKRLQAAIALILQNAEAWQSEIVPRHKIDEFTGGAYSPAYFANLDSDSKRQGVDGAFKIGRHVCYPKKNLSDFLISKLEV